MLEDESIESGPVVHPLVATSGKMTKAEKSLKMRIFAKMLLDPESSHSKEDICAALSISESTYYKWSKDDSLVELSGFEPARENMVTAIMASQLRKSALITLKEVMDNEFAGSMARVQAAKTILEYIPDQVEIRSDVNGLRARSIILMNQPFFVQTGREVVGTITGLMAGMDILSRDVPPADVDGEFTVVEDDEDDDDTD